MTQMHPSAWHRLGNALETGLLSSLAAGGLGLATWFASHSAYYALWLAWPAAGLAFLPGAIVGALRVPRVSTLGWGLTTAVALVGLAVPLAVIIANVHILDASPWLIAILASVAVLGLVGLVLWRPEGLKPWPWALAMFSGVSIGSIAFITGLAWANGSIVPSTQVVSWLQVSAFVTAVVIGVSSALARRKKRRTVIATRAAILGAIAAIIAVSQMRAHAQREAQSANIHDVAVTASGQIYVATDFGVLTSDPGTTRWRPVMYQGDPCYARKIVADLRDPHLVCASLNSGTFVESRTNGRTWRRIAGIQNATVIAAARDYLYAVSEDGWLWVRRRGAWEEHRAPTTTGDWGLPVVLTKPLAVSLRNPPVILAGSRYDGSLRLSGDSGRTWRLLTYPCDGPTWVSGVAFVPGVSEAMLVATRGGLLMSLDEGRSWRRIGPPDACTSEHPPDTYEAIVVASTQPPTIYALGERMHFQASDDLGRVWRDVLVRQVRKLRPQCMAVDPRDPHTVYVGFTQGLYRSHDDGRTWERIR